MTEEEELNNMIEGLYQDYIQDGFDFDTQMTFDEVFRKIFSDAVACTLKVLEDDEKEE